MARIRSIHPGLTSDEAYMSMSITAKAAWTPLWMQCDDHGIFEWKPIVLKALIFPADAVDMASLLEEWVSLGCIKKIDVDGKACGVVRNFSRYQRPKNPSYRYFKADELPTDISKYIGVRSAPPVLPQSSPSPTEVLPQRKEEGGRREEEKKEITQPVAKATRGASEKFEEFWKERPRRDGDDPRKPAEKKFNALVKTGVDPDVMISGARLATIAAKERGIYGTKFVPQTVKWLNDQRFVDYAAEAYSEDGQNKPSEGDAFWDSILTSFKRFGYWSGQAGPGLDSPDCRVPDEMLAKHGLSRTVVQPIEAPRLKSMGDLH